MTFSVLSIALTSCGSDDKPKQGDMDFVFEGINVHASGVTATQAQNVLDLLQNIYDGWNAVRQGRFTDGRVAEIHIRPGTGTNIAGGILTIHCGDTPAQISTVLNSITVAQTKQKNALILAKKLDTKKFIISQRAIDKYKRLEKFSSLQNSSVS